MTKKDYVRIADILGKKLSEVSTWSNVEAQSLSIAYIEDFTSMLESENKKFDKKRFIDYINQKYNTNLVGA